MQNRKTDAIAYHAQAMERVENTPVPTNQKFAPGTRVRIADDLGPMMAHFESGKNATVEYTYAQAYGGDNVDSYSLLIDGYGSVAWYHERQLTLIEGGEQPPTPEDQKVFSPETKKSQDALRKIGKDLFERLAEEVDQKIIESTLEST